MSRKQVEIGDEGQAKLKELRDRDGVSNRARLLAFIRKEHAKMLREVVKDEHSKIPS